jgi:hypothetical protein
MADCKHADLEFVGEQKTDSGINAYFRCKACNWVVVVTPERKAFAIKSVPEPRN